MEFTIKISEKNMKALRQFIANQMDSHLNDVSDVEALNEVFFISDSGRGIGHDLDLRDEVKITRRTP